MEEVATNASDTDRIDKETLMNSNVDMDPSWETGGEMEVEHQGIWARRMRVAADLLKSGDALETSTIIIIFTWPGPRWVAGYTESRDCAWQSS
jgi:hypothetical protein